MAASVQAEAHLLGDDFVEATERALAAGQPVQVSDAELERVMTAAVRLYAAKAETQLMYASDWPHWDFDAPSSITTLPFLNEQAKRNILGLNAARIFGLDPTPRKTL
jgi:predicted TIM-barrel fold metal-dependent hydrolase